MTGPDAIIIGAMKCATSTMAAQLGAQPGIFLTDPKEPNYFSDDAIYARGPGWYAALFDASKPGEVRLEASTHYTKRPDLPATVERMRKALPNVRLVYMIRDPMARLVSHYVHAWSENWIRDDLKTAIATYPPLIDYGLYGMQIAPFVETWGAEAICLTSQERMRADPGGELARVAAHIGHDGPVAWDKTLGAENVSAERARKLPLHGLLVANPVATILRRALVPRSLRRRVRESRRMKDRPEIPVGMRPALHARFLADRETLARFFPGDPSLDLAYPFAASPP